MPQNLLSVVKYLKAFLFGTKYCREFHPFKIKLLPDIVENRQYTGSELRILLKKFPGYCELTSRTRIEDEASYSPNEVVSFLNRCSILNLAFIENCQNLLQHNYANHPTPRIEGFQPIIDRAVIADTNTDPIITLDIREEEEQLLPGSYSLSIFPFMGKDL